MTQLLSLPRHPSNDLADTLGSLNSLLRQLSMYPPLTLSLTLPFLISTPLFACNAGDLDSIPGWEGLLEKG